MKLKSPTRGVILDLIKSHVYWLSELLIIAIPFIGVVCFFLDWLPVRIPHRDPEWLWVVQLTISVSQTITADFLLSADETAPFTPLTFMRLPLCFPHCPYSCGM